MNYWFDDVPLTQRRCGGAMEAPLVNIPPAIITGGPDATLWWLQERARRACAQAHLRHQRNWWRFQRGRCSKPEEPAVLRYGRMLYAQKNYLQRHMERWRAVPVTPGKGNRWRRRAGIPLD